MITAQIRLEVPRETVVVVADTQRAVDNIVAALQEEGVYEDHALLTGRALTSDMSVRFDSGAWISGPCLDVDDLEADDVYADEADDADADELDGDRPSDH